jgi:hypothetical protein
MGGRSLNFVTSSVGVTVFVMDFKACYVRYLPTPGIHFGVSAGARQGAFIQLRRQHFISPNARKFATSGIAWNSYSGPSSG